MEDDLNLFCKWKMTSTFLMEDNLNLLIWMMTSYFLKMEDSLISFVNGRHLKCFVNVRRPFFVYGKKTSIYVLS
jgi:hypothetical protein